MNESLIQLKEPFMPSATIGHLASRHKFLGVRTHSIAHHSVVGKLCSGTLLASWQLSSMGKGSLSRLPSGKNVSFLSFHVLIIKSLWYWSRKKSIAFGLPHINGQIAYACLKSTMRSEL